MYRFTLGAGALTLAMIGATFSIPAKAADMALPVELPPAVNEGPIEWGSDWYLRGDLGLAATTPVQVDFVRLSNSFPNGWNIGLGGGYKFNNYFRGDVTVDYQSLFNKNGLVTDQPQPCRIGMFLDPNNQGAVKNVYSDCRPMVRNRAEAMLVLANAYVDLGNWYGFTPYVGAGVGLNVLYQRSQVNWYMGNGVPYAGVTYTDPRTSATYMENWDARYEGTHLRFAYALMGGVAYDIDDHWKVDVGYRYANMGKITGIDQFNRQFSQNLHSHQLRVGFRYMID